MCITENFNWYEIKSLNEQYKSSSYFNILSIGLNLENKCDAANFDMEWCPVNSALRSVVKWIVATVVDLDFGGLSVMFVRLMVVGRIVSP